MRTAWLVLGQLVVGLALHGCGGTSKSAADGPSAIAGSRGLGAGSSGTGTGGSSGGRPATGGGSSNAGSGALGGTATGGGVAIGGGVAMGGNAGDGSGGTAACVEGAPCNCKALTGTTKCSAAGAECTCPAASKCQEENGAPCFEPCGGEPFGIWRLDDACFADTHVAENSACEPFLTAKPGKSTLMIKFSDGGQYSVGGQERWTVSSQVPLACLSIESVNRCVDATFYSEVTLFSESTPGGCTANACGVCDCTTEVDRYATGFGSNWSRAGNQLKLDSATVDYCVQGDTLWLGGKRDGVPKAAYKFSKHSCEGTPVPCSQRTPEQCTMSLACTVGQCKGKTAAQLGCESQSEEDCGVTEGCVWDPKGCYGDPIGQPCTIDNCDTELGCSWGAPKQRCAGEPRPCCTGIASESGDCALLDHASCSKGVGCQITSTGCIGQPSCSTQSDPTICGAMGCAFPSGCKSTECSKLSVGDCHTIPGCYLDW